MCGGAGNAAYHFDHSATLDDGERAGHDLIRCAVDHAPHRPRQRAWPASPSGAVPASSGGPEVPVGAVEPLVASGGLVVSVGDVIGVLVASVGLVVSVCDVIGVLVASDGRVVAGCASSVAGEFT